MSKEILLLTLLVLFKLIQISSAKLRTKSFKVSQSFNSTSKGHLKANSIVYGLPQKNDPIGLSYEKLDQMQSLTHLADYLSAKKQKDRSKNFLKIKSSVDLKIKLQALTEKFNKQLKKNKAIKIDKTKNKAIKRRNDKTDMDSKSLQNVYLYYEKLTQNRRINHQFNHQQNSKLNNKLRPKLNHQINHQQHQKQTYQQNHSQNHQQNDKLNHKLNHKLSHKQQQKQPHPQNHQQSDKLSPKLNHKLSFNQQKKQPHPQNHQQNHNQSFEQKNTYVVKQDVQQDIKQVLYISQQESTAVLKELAPFVKQNSLQKYQYGILFSSQFVYYCQKIIQNMKRILAPLKIVRQIFQKYVFQQIDKKSLKNTNRHYQDKAKFVKKVPFLKQMLSQCKQISIQDAKLYKQIYNQQNDHFSNQDQITLLKIIHMEASDNVDSCLQMGQFLFEPQVTQLVELNSLNKQYLQMLIKYDGHQREPFEIHLSPAYNKKSKLKFALEHQFFNNEASPIILSANNQMKKLHPILKKNDSFQKMQEEKQNLMNAKLSDFKQNQTNKIKKKVCFKQLSTEKNK